MNQIESQKENIMPNLKELMDDPEYAAKEAEKFAETFVARVEPAEDMNSGLENEDQLIACLNNAGAQNIEAYKKFCAIGAEDY